MNSDGACGKSLRDFVRNMKAHASSRGGFVKFLPMRFFPAVSTGIFCIGIEEHLGDPEEVVWKSFLLPTAIQGCGRPQYSTPNILQKSESRSFMAPRTRRHKCRINLGRLSSQLFPCAKPLKKGHSDVLDWCCRGGAGRRVRAGRWARAWSDEKRNDTGA